MFPSASNRCVTPVMRRSRIAKTELRRNRIPHIWRAPGFASSRTCPTFFRKCSARPPLVDLWVDTDVNRRGGGRLVRRGEPSIPSALGASVSISVQSNEKPERILRMLEGARIHAPKWNNKRARGCGFASGARPEVGEIYISRSL